jgi:4-amino-4-deoxy-L-arabinose transferase-like glycosyltransferase
VRTKSFTQKQKALHYLVITLAFLLIWAVLCVNLNEPFFGHREGGSVWNAAATRNWIQFGPDALDYLPIRTPGPTTPETGLYYLHHPPVKTWFIAVCTWLFGYDTVTSMPYELSIRMVGMLFALPTLALIYAVARRLFDRKTALISLLLYGSTPMIFYFGRMPYYDMVIMPFILAYIAVFINWMGQPTRQRSFILLIMAITMMWIAWPAAFYLAGFGVVALIYGDGRQRRSMILIGGITLLFTLAIPLLYEALRPGTITELYDMFRYRASNAESGEGSAPFTLAEFVARWLKDMFTTTSFAVTILGFLGMIIVLRRPKKQLQEVILITLIVIPFVFMLIVRNSFHFHDWYKVHFMPALVIAGAILIKTGWQLPPKGIKRYVRPLIFAILVTSLAVTVYWTVMLQQTTYNDFARTLARELPAYTVEDDLIGSNVSRPYSEIEYYAYRNVIWGISVENAVKWYNEATEDEEAYYLLCLDENPVDSYAGLLSELPYQVVTENCRLVSLSRTNNE